jgi:glycosyltransferase involved in cell wall biosynthesis
MKILITSIIDPKKSPHSRLHHLIKSLGKDNQITILCINDWWKSSLTNAGVYVKGSDDFFKNVEIKYYTNKKVSPVFQELFSFLAMRRLVDFKEFDLHINYNTLISGYFVSKKIKPTIYDIADYLPEMVSSSPQIPRVLRLFGGIFGKFILNRNIKNARKVIYTTEPLKEAYSINDNNAVVIPNGVDTTIFYRYSPEEIKNQLKINDVFVLGYVGVLREWVDFKPVLKAVESLVNKDYKLKIVIVGEEGYLKETKRMVEKHGLKDQVIFVGTVPYADVPKYIGCMDVCLIPFKNDAVSVNSLPLKLFEYMSCEKPVISFNLRGISDAVGNRVLYASTPEEYEENIKKLYEDASLRTVMGLAGREFVIQYYDWNVIESSIFETLKEAVQ